MSIDDHSRMRMSRPIVILNPILTSTSDDFTRIELKGCYWVFESMSLGDGAHTDIPYLPISQFVETRMRGTYSDGLVKGTCDDVHFVKLEAGYWRSVAGQCPVSLTSTH